MPTTYEQLTFNNADLLRRWWADGNGNAIESVEGYVLLWQGVPAFIEGPAGKAESYVKAFDLSGSNNIYVGELTRPASGQLTLCAWIYPESNGVHVIFAASEYHPNANESWCQFFRNSNGAIHARINQNGSATIRIGRSTNANAAPLNTWTHVAMAWNGSNSAGGISVFINGVKADTTNDNGGAFTGVYANPTRAAIGAQYDLYPTAANRFVGAISDMRLYDLPLDENVDLPGLIAGPTPPISNYDRSIFAPIFSKLTSSITL
jgi:hypothetical protein